uniref:Pentatricopeptide repeat-containing protein n=1 Tax=Ananas comosus var. bracteatus TaxID=296719 RepID=A0A6V7PTX5_ANACO|nr:unnamed protein product [Ananas comosus var. bracteatus]
MRAISPSPAHLQTLRFARPISTGPVPTGPPPSSYEANTRLKRLVESDCLNEARHLFDEMPHRDEVSYTTIISGYVRASDPLGALSLFSRMRSATQRSPRRPLRPQPRLQGLRLRPLPPPPRRRTPRLRP